MTDLEQGPGEVIAAPAPTDRVSWVNHPWVLTTRAMVLAGIWLGALVGGLGGRVAMLVLRVLSPDSVHGVESDDGFIIGRLTLSGTYSLILIGAGAGVVGAAAYRWVDHWLIGPGWFRQLSAALGAGAVVGSMLVHTDGVDFNVLEPLWLAIAFFVLIPAVFGFLIGPLERRLARPESWVNQGTRRWLLPLVSVVVFLPIVVLVFIAVAVTLLWTPIKETRVYGTVRENPVFGVVVRGAWLAVAVAGLVSLVSDAQTILA